MTHRATRSSRSRAVLSILSPILSSEVLFRMVFAGTPSFVFLSHGVIGILYIRVRRPRER